jgi:hypothetical protein
MLLQQHYQENGDAILTSVNKVLTGEGSIEDVMGALGKTVTSTKDLFEGAFKTAVENAKTGMDDMSKSQNHFIKMLDGALGVFKKSEGLENNTTTANAPTNQNVTINPSVNQMASTNAAGTAAGANQTITTNANSNISLNIKIDAPSNVDTAQLQTILNDPKFQRDLMTAIQSASKNSGLTPEGNPMKK